MKRGSITVFASLAFMLIASFLFALLEAGRMQQLSCYADMRSELALESVCGEYQSGLWEDYHLLCLDGAYGGKEFDIDYVTGVLGARICTNLEQEGAGARIMGLEFTGAEPVSYQLLTDGEGAVFLHCVSEYMKENLPMEIAQTIYDKYSQTQTVEESQQTEGSVEQAQNAIDEARQQLADDEAGQQQVGGGAMPQEELGSIEGGDAGVSESVVTEAEPVEENPLEVVLSLKQNLLLGMVTEDVGALSTKQIQATETMENRSLEVGTDQEIPQVNWYDKVFALEYVDSYFGDYLNPASEHALAYELEYLLGGKDSDKDNLESVIGRLLLVREAANVTHILMDAGKRSSASAMATALAGFTGNPAIIQVVEIGIVAAWAYVESILDIRALLSGDKIALIKSKMQWVTQLGSLGTALSGGGAKDCEDGLSYLDYLKAFLFATNSQKLAYRMMDVMEQNIRLVAAYQNCRMDHMICRMEYDVSYQADSLFWQFSILSNQVFSGMQFQNNKSFSYY